MYNALVVFVVVASLLALGLVFGPIGILWGLAVLIPAFVYGTKFGQLPQLVAQLSM